MKALTLLIFLSCAFPAFAGEAEKVFDPSLLGFLILGGKVINFHFAAQLGIFGQ